MAFPGHKLCYSNTPADHRIQIGPQVHPAVNVFILPAALSKPTAHSFAMASVFLSS